MGISQAEKNQTAEDAAEEEETKFMTVEATREGEKSDEGSSAVNAE